MLPELCLILSNFFPIANIHITSKVSMEILSLPLLSYCVGETQLLFLYYTKITCRAPVRMYDNKRSYSRNRITLINVPSLYNYNNT